VFWEQQGLQTFGHRIQITRPHASQPAFERHFLQMMEEYGATHAINLLGQKENEALLTSAYARHLAIAKQGLGDELGITNFDFHSAVRIGGHDSVPREIRCACGSWILPPLHTHQMLDALRVLQTTSIDLGSRCAMLLRTKLSRIKRASSEPTVWTGQCEFQQPIILPILSSLESR
jgi:SacI homology domain